MKKETRETQEAFILDAINTDDYEVVANTPKEKLQFIADCIVSEAIYPNNIKRHKGHLQSLIAEHLMGLPSWLDIPFTNCDILQLGRKWGYKLETEKKEDKFLDNYWNAVALWIVRLFDKYNIEVKGV